MALPTNKPPVLVVESHVVFRNLLARFLEQEGYSVLVAAGREEAVPLSRAFATQIRLLVVSAGLRDLKLLTDDFAREWPGVSVLILAPFKADEHRSSALPEQWKTQLRNALLDHP